MFILISFASSHVMAREKCKVNVLNAICLGGSLVDFQSKLPWQMIENVGDVDGHKSVSIYRVNGLYIAPSTNISVNKSKLIFINNLFNNNSLSHIVVRAFNDVIYDIDLEFKYDDSISRARLISDLNNIYGTPSHKSGNFISWVGNTYTVLLGLSPDNYASLSYTIESIQARISKAKGF